MSKISFPTKTFIVLFCIAFFGSFLVMSLWSNLYNQPINQMIKVYSPQRQANALKAKLQQQQQVAQAPSVDTSTWKTYTSKDFGFTFKYKPDWKVLAVTKKGGFSIIQVDPGSKFYNIKIYVSDKGYNGIDGLPSNPDTIGGLTGVNVNDLLYGVKSGTNYFTFDVGVSTSLKTDFGGLVHSVTFTK